MDQNLYKPGEYWQERLTTHFSLAGVGHLGFSEEYNHWVYKARLRVLDDILKRNKIDSSRKRVLDIGVGIGFYIPFWEKLKVLTYAGVDITQKSVETLRLKYPYHTFIQADITDPALPINGKFDIITAFDVLFHITSDEQFIQAITNIKKLCHDKTIVLIMDNFLSGADVLVPHQKSRTYEFYKTILGSKQMRIIDLRPIFFFLNTPVDARRMTLPTRTILISMWWINLRLSAFAKILSKAGKWFSFSWGALLYLIDLIILWFVRWGPSTKIIAVKSLP